MVTNGFQTSTLGGKFEKYTRILVGNVRGF